jgi:epoxyqueuosine reductase
MTRAGSEDPAAMTTTAIKAKAEQIGFDLCGVSRASRHPKLARLQAWIDAGSAGDMAYLLESLDERLDVTAVLPTARSVVSLGVVYNTRQPYSQAALEPGHVAVARYAWGDDYHDVLRARVRALLIWMAECAGPGFEAFSCVDNGPIQERVFAEQAGLGWIVKNTCLINPQLGSWLFLAEVVTNLDLEPDAPGVDQCGTCTRCLEACPTGAITEPYAVDATRCLSYVTIEQRTDVAMPMRAAVSQQLVGCDICQDVCPWNRRASESDDPAWQARPDLLYPRLLDLCRLSDDGWRQLLKGSAMRRAGLRRIRRSLAYASVHLSPAEARAALDALSGHPTARYREVDDAIRWAQGAIERPD